MEEWNKIFDSEILIRCMNQVDKYENISPARGNILRCFNYFPPEKLQCVIIGQNPYTYKGSANGLAFSSDAQKLPKTLIRIYQRLLDLSLISEMPKHGNLEKWAAQGVLLLNTVLTYVPDCTQDFWLEFTTDVLKKILMFPQKIVFMIWGIEAKKIFTKAVEKLQNPYWNRDSLKTILEYIHPSPTVGVSKWGCNHFMKIKIDWDVSICKFFTDGSCDNNGKVNAKGGWSVILENYPVKAYYGKLYERKLVMSKGVLKISKSEQFATNIRGEGYAIIFAILKAKDMLVNAHIVTDCKHWIRVYNDYMNNWETNGVIDEKANPDMTRILLELSKQVKVVITHVSAHTTNQDDNSNGNRLADSLAKEGKLQEKFCVKILN